MVISVPLSDQLTAARDDSLGVLVVGAGVAGVTVARLLHQEGLHPVLLEHSDTGAAGGYMLGLMPLVNQPMRRLGAWQDYLERSVPMHRYQLRSSRGGLVRTYSLDAALGEYGRFGGISRGDLLQTLSGGGVRATLGATVTSLRQTHEGVRATLHSAAGDSEVRFDVVIVADGMHSATRDLVLASENVDTVDTGWGGWVAWAESHPDQTDLYAETWGRGFFVGRYSVRGGMGVFVGGPRASTVVGPAPFVAQVRERLRRVDPMTSRALNAIEQTPEPYYWRFTDTRSKRWAIGRVILLGDAAAGFLPTAGVGAAMAMESAGVLAQGLADARADEIPRILREYEQRQRPRVMAAHDNSRDLARLMFREGRVSCRLRDLAMRVATLKMALRPIIRLHQNAPLTGDDPGMAR